ncbi:MAG: hypothetical protein CSA26_01925 [Desulfobacterales bacterium]|nr:MAG: hypothetical protein CSA26_01925 [Desulfobacterales bacterium]
MFSTSSILYALAGCAVVYLFQQRRRQLSRIKPDDLPELNDQDYQQLILLLKMAYERTLYMGVLFFPLAWSARESGSNASQLFFLILITLLFISNVIPRHKVMKLLEQNQLTTQEMRKRGIVL